MKKYDIVVVGGGYSGVCAAIAAARQGANVLLADKSNCLGGAATNCLVTPLMYFWTIINKADKKGEFNNLTNSFFYPEKGRLYLCRGILFEIIERLHGHSPNMKECSINNEDLKLVLNRMCLESGVNLLYHAYFTGSNKDENNNITSVDFATKSGKISFEAKYFIDATGDADVAVSCGCPTKLGRESDNLCQPMTLCFRLGNIDKEKFFKEKPAMNELYIKLQAEGKIKNPRENILTFDTLSDGIIHFNTTRVCKLNPVDPFDVTRAEVEAREQVYELYYMLKENFESCKGADLIMTAAEIGVRESRMIDGEHMLTQEDLVACTKFDDAIAAGNYDIDIHNPDGSGTSHYYFPKGTYYTIPYRSLIPKNVNNLLVAGRCISASHEAQASIRIMPICAALGQAAGTAASVALKNNATIKDIKIKELQATLKENGAFVGE